MKPRTEELLYLLLWTADSLARPSWRNMTGSFEAWAYRNGLQRQLDRLEAQAFIERQRSGLDGRWTRLTESGRLRALGGKDPVKCWNRGWDGKWRALMFDLPTAERALRARVRRALHSRGYGNLQRSVWVSPDPPDDFRSRLFAQRRVRSLICLEGVPCGGESDRDIVLGAWNWDLIHARYEDYHQVLRSFPEDQEGSAPRRDRLLEWAGRERLAWKAAVDADPFLPEELLPREYAGKKAWHARVERLACAGKLISQEK